MPLVRKDTPKPAEPMASAAPALLGSGTTEERWSAVRSVSGAAAESALIAALETEEDERVRGAIFSRLALAGTPAAIDAILQRLRSDEASLRTAALDALRSAPAAMRSRLAALLSDPDRDVRLLSCEIARTLPSAEAEPLLCALLENEGDANVCGAAVEVLAEVGTTFCLVALDHCAARHPSDAFLQFSIRLAREQVGSRPIGRP